MDKHLDFSIRRSITSYIKDGWQAFALHWRAYLRFQWPGLLLASICAGLLLTVALRYANGHLLPAAALRDLGIPASVVRSVAIPGGGLAALGLLATAACIAAWLLWKGMVYTQMQHCLDAGELPSGGALRLWKAAVRNAARCLAADAALAVLWAVPAAAITYAAFAWTKWLLLLLLPLIVFAGVTGTEAEVRHLLARVPLQKAVSHAYGAGLRRAGGLFIVRLLTLIPCCAVALAALQPVAALTLASTTNANGILMGDPDGLPPYFYPLFAAVTAIAAAALLLSFGLRLWSSALQVMSGAVAQPSREKPDTGAADDGSPTT